MHTVALNIYTFQGVSKLMQGFNHNKQYPKLI